MSGEHLIAAPTRADADGSSPRERGALFPGLVAQIEGRIIPA